MYSGTAAYGYGTLPRSGSVVAQVGAAGENKPIARPDIYGTAVRRTLKPYRSTCFDSIPRYSEALVRYTDHSKSRAVSCPTEILKQLSLHDYTTTYRNDYNARGCDSSQGPDHRSTFSFGPNSQYASTKLGLPVESSAAPRRVAPLDWSPNYGVGRWETVIKQSNSKPTPSLHFTGDSSRVPVDLRNHADLKDSNFDRQYSNTLDTKHVPKISQPEKYRPLGINSEGRRSVYETVRRSARTSQSSRFVSIKTSRCLNRSMSLVYRPRSHWKFIL